MKNVTYWLFSLSIHLALLVFATTYYTTNKVSPALGHPLSQVMDAFIFNGRLDQERINSSDMLSIKPKTISNQPKHSKSSIKSVSTKQPTHQEKSRPVLTQGESSTALIALLHDAIQAKQAYPKTALRMEREGKVKVAFNLLTNGHVTDVQVKMTSGTASLDQAAMAAVMNAAPFQQLINYIHENKEYQIDIIFKLT